jgi:diguanylate cyclase
MTHLVGFHLDYLKIDRTFVDPLPASDLHTRFVRGLLALAREVGLATVAEGIETAEQLAVLKALGCTRGQGTCSGAPCRPASSRTC